MKTTKIQFNAKSFKGVRDTISAYFGAKFDLAVELDKTRKAVASVSKVIATDKAQLEALAMGLDNVDGAKIVRDVNAIRESLKANTATYNATIAPYNALVETTEKAIADAVSLFGGDKGVLYKAYCAYVTDTTDDNYNAYANAMVDTFKGFGLADATADNVAHFMPNVDRELRGTTAVKKGDIQSSVNYKTFANSVLRKIRTQNKEAFSSAKFLKYVETCKAKSKKN